MTATPPGAPADVALDVLRRNAGSDRPAVTTLSVDEAVLLDQVGYEPVEMVSGASVVQVASFARLGVGFSTNGELTQLSEALEASRVRAIERLADAAGRAGAHGVVGASLDLGDLGGGGNLVHLVATGTGVRRKGIGGPAGANGRPFTASLSGQEIHLLERAGYAPLGIVSGVCAYHVGRQAFGRWAGSVTVNQEMTIYTEALYDARELAMGRLQDMALALGADGVIGVTVTERSGVWGAHVIEFGALGTAVRSVAGQHRRLDPRLVMDLAAGA
jgi:uncharacterized protein YbjQ (UPF0145 family)